MKWSIQELNKFKDTGLTIDTTLDLKDSLLKRDQDILDVSPVHVKGHLTVNPREYIVVGEVKCQVTVPSTRTLVPTTIDLNFTFDEIYMTKEQFENRIASDDDDFIMVLDKDYIDLDSIVEDYILLNIPLQVLTSDEMTSDEMPKGNDWEVISEAEYEQRQAAKSETQINPELAKLQQLFADNDD